VLACPYLLCLEQQQQQQQQHFFRRLLFLPRKHHFFNISFFLSYHFFRFFLDSLLGGCWGVTPARAVSLETLKLAQNNNCKIEIGFFVVFIFLVVVVEVEFLFTTSSFFFSRRRRRRRRFFSSSTFAFLLYSLSTMSMKVSSADGVKVRQITPL